MGKINRLESTREMGRCLDTYYHDLRHAREDGKKVAWTGGTAPFIHLSSQDIRFHHAESYGAYTAGRKVHEGFLEASEIAGYSPEVCSYERISLGHAWKMFHNEKIDPVYELPRPDFAYCSRCCPNHAYFIDGVSRIFKVPRVIVDIPIVRDESEFDETVAYVENQFNDVFIPFIEQILGHKYNWDTLMEETAILKKVIELRSHCLDMCKQHSPAPMTFSDASMSIAVVLSLGGKPETLGYYERLKAEVDQRVQNKVGALPNEKYRLFWDHLPIWYKLRELSDKFASYDANVVGATYTDSLAFPRYAHKWDPERPIHSLSDFLVRSNQYFFPQHRLEHVVNLCREYSVDGVILHNHRSCRYMDYDQYETAKEIESQLGIPTVVIQGDAADPQFLSVAQLDAQLDAFMEMVESRKHAV